MESLSFWFGNFANLLGIVTFFLSLFTWLRVQRQNRELREISKRIPPSDLPSESRVIYAGITSERPVALAVSLLHNTPSIKMDVDRFLRAQSLTMPIQEVHMDGINSDSDRDVLLQKLRGVRRDFDVQEFTEVHLFVAGPVQAGTIIGALFDQWKPVKLYHRSAHPGGQTYEFWMPLMDH